MTTGRRSYARRVADADSRGRAVAAQPRARLLAFGVLLLAAAAVPLVAELPPAAQLRDAGAAAGPWSPAVSVVAIAALAVTLVPRAATAALAGLLLGPVTGTACALAGLVLGALAAFTIGRTLGRPAVARHLATRSEHSRVVRLQAWVERHGVLAVVYARLVPLLPFGVLNYGFSLTSVRARSFAAGTAIGIAPSTALYATAGASVTDPTSRVFLVSAALAGALLLLSLLARRFVVRG